jgi:uncharacterized RDD family membrane protein YckC
MTQQVIFTNPSQERTVAEFVTYSQKEAGFWMRFWAFLIDTLIVSAIIGICINPIFYLFDWDLGSTNWYAPIVIISGIIYYTYFILMTKIFAQTVGKMIFGLKVRTDSGAPLDWMTVIFREGVGRFISNTFMKLPYLIVAVTPQHKALHDYAADTIVVHEESFKEARKKRYVEDVQNEVAPVVTAQVVETEAVKPELHETSLKEVTQAPIETSVVDVPKKVEAEAPKQEETVEEVPQQVTEEHPTSSIEETPKLESDKQQEVQQDDKPNLEK